MSTLDDLNYRLSERIRALEFELGEARMEARAERERANRLERWWRSHYSRLTARISARSSK